MTKPNSNDHLALAALNLVRCTIADAILHGDLDAVWDACQIASTTIDLAKDRTAAIEHFAQTVATWWPQCADNEVESLDTTIADTFDCETEGAIHDAVARLS